MSYSLSGSSKCFGKPEVVTHAFNPSTLETGGFMRPAWCMKLVSGHPGL